jgi:DNA gyrase subunit A
MAAVEPEGPTHGDRPRLRQRSHIEDYRLQTRGGKGIINIRVTERNGRVVAVPFVRDEDELMVITAQGMIMRLRVKDFAVHSRATQGVRLIELSVKGDHVVAGDSPPKSDAEEEARRAKRAVSRGFASILIP